jgi:hypothetical protein
MNGLKPQSQLANMAAFFPQEHNAPLPRMDGVRYSPTSTGLRYVLEVILNIFRFDVPFHYLSLDKQENLRNDIATLYGNLSTYQGEPMEFELSDRKRYKLEQDPDQPGGKLQLKLLNTDQTLHFEKTKDELINAVKNHVLHNAVNYVSGPNPKNATEERILDLVKSAILDETIPLETRQKAVAALEGCQEGNENRSQFTKVLREENPAKFISRHEFVKVGMTASKVAELFTSQMPFNIDSDNTGVLGTLKSQVEEELSRLNPSKPAFDLAKSRIAAKFTELDTRKANITSILERITFKPVMQLALSNKIYNEIMGCVTETNEIDPTKGEKLKKKIQSIIKNAKAPLNEAELGSLKTMIVDKFREVGIPDLPDNVDLFLAEIHLPAART